MRASRPIWYNSDDEDSQAGVSLLELRTPPRSPRFAARPHNITALLSASSPESSASDTASSNTDRSGGPHAMPSDVPALHRMSSVTLAEDMDEGNSDREEGEIVEDRPYTPFRFKDEQDELDIPLNCVTQDKVLHPRKRPAPSPASARGYPTGPDQYSWKRQHYQQPLVEFVKAEEPMAEPEATSPMSDGASPVNAETSPRQVKIDSKSSTLATLASNLLRQLEDEPVGTLVVCQPTCLDHHNDSHQESRQRLTVLGGPEGVLLKDRFQDLTWANLDELRPARLNDLLRVHTFEYIQHLEKSCNKLPLLNEEYLVGTLFEDGSKSDSKKNRSLPYSQWVKSEKAEACFNVEDPPSAGTLDMDSPISKNSYLAARMAAGAVCHAIDKVLTNQYRNAFVVVRPPGHHAGPNGCVDGEGFHLRPEMCTCGFCLLNNVCIGAAYAMTNYSGPYYTPSPSRHQLSAASGHRPLPTIERIAIVDFDIHHGNGTEEIIRNLVPHKQNYPLPPSWAPVSFSSYKPWRDDKDSDNVFFASIHLFDDENFYPCSGSGPNGCSPELRDHKNVINMPLEVLGPRFLDERQKLSSKAQKALMERASKAFRENVTNRLLPALTAFQPDLIMLSAGFDGHADDFYYYLSEDDYGWITEQIIAVADDCCDGRIVSVLEGGYNVVPAKGQQRTRGGGRKNAAVSNFHHAAKLHNREVDPEMTSYGSLARSCAAHVAALQEASRA